MPLIIVCPSGHRLKVPKKHAGHRIICPVCSQRISVPALSSPEAKTGDPPPSPAANRDAKAAVPTTAEPPSPAPAGDAGQEELRSHVDSNATPETEVAEHDPAAAAARPISAEELRPIGVEEQREESNAGAPPLDQPPLAAFDIQERGPTHADGLSLPLIREELPLVGQRLTQQSFEASFKSEQRLGVWVLGIAAIVVAVFCAIPSVMDQVATRRVGLQSADTWTYIVLLATTIQIAVAIYAIRLPDWSTSWIASLIATGFAAMYALGLALTMFASQEHQIVRQLGLLDEAFHWRAQLWCFLVMCVTLILAYCYGRFSLRWYKLEKQLIESRG